MNNLENLFEKFGIQQESLKSNIIQNMGEFEQSVNNTESIEILWDSTINNYYKSIDKIRNALNNENINHIITRQFINGLDNFLEVCRDPEFHIAFVGAIKAGKSTLINSLLGQDLASTSVTPETASLTKFKATREINYIKVKFYSESEWDDVWESVQNSKATVFLEEYNNLNASEEKDDWIGKEEIKKTFDNIDELRDDIKTWTSSQRASHYFVKEVEVGLVNSSIPDGVVYVDTPGLDDPVKYRSNITRAYIERANAVLVCVKSDALTGQEINTIYKVFTNSRYNPEKIYIIGTQLDTLNRPEQDWEYQKSEWVKHLSKNECYGKRDLAENNIVAVASYLYNMIRKTDTLSADDIEFELDPIAKKFRIRDCEKNLEQLSNHSNIPMLKNKLSDEIIQKHKQILVDDIKNKYLNNKESLLNITKNIRDMQMDLLTAHDSDLDTIQNQVLESKEILEHANNTKIELENTIKEIKTLTEDKASELYKQIKNLRVE